MHLRPSLANWFEVQIPRDQTVWALEALAASGMIELEDDPMAGPREGKEELRRILGELHRIEVRHAALLPTDEVPPPRLLATPEDAARQALATVRRWFTVLLRRERHLRRLERDRDHLNLLAECLTAMHGQSEGLEGFGKGSRFLYKQILACPRGQLAEPTAERVVSEVFVGDRHDFWLVAGAPDHASLVDSAATLLSCEAVAIPDWLKGSVPEQWRALSERLAEAERAIAEADAALVAHRADPGVRTALANASVLDWYTGIELRETEDHKACNLAGWTAASSPAEIEDVLRRAGIQATVVFAESGSFEPPPIALDEARWLAPFRWLVALFGTPARTEVDPSPILAFMVPLLFGLMFPDVGHGLVLVAAGVVLSRYSPAGAVLVRCGLAATLLGFGFGEFFGIHGILPAPFGRPLDHPIEILVGSLALGVVVLLLGLVFSGVEAVWRDDLRRWMLEGAPVLVLYLSLLTALLLPPALLGAGIAVLWYVIGAVLLCRPARMRCVGARVGHLFEASLQLAMNTLSFLRVGAFALAHCALSLVVIELTLSVDNLVLRGALFVVGQIVIILFEGLVVSVQITRLVLFEFFIRFIRLEGRPYRPLTLPTAIHKH